MGPQPSAPRQNARSQAGSHPPEGVCLKQGGHSQRKVGVLSLVMPYWPIHLKVLMSSKQEW